MPLAHKPDHLSISWQPSISLRGVSIGASERDSLSKSVVIEQGVTRCSK